MKLDDDTVVTAAQLSWLMGLSDRALRGYANRGVVVRAGRGKYRLGESVRRLYHHASEAAAGRAGTGLADARSKLALLQAEGQALRNAALRGEAVLKVDAIDTWRTILRGVRQMMLAWPGKAAFELPVLGRAERAVLDRIVRDDLDDAALGRGFDLGGAESGQDERKSALVGIDRDVPKSGEVS
jgi:terminase small subunit / prophage DNA-packing protein